MSQYYIQLYTNNFCKYALCSTTHPMTKQPNRFGQNTLVSGDLSSPNSDNPRRISVPIYENVAIDTMETSVEDLSTVGAFCDVSAIDSTRGRERLMCSVKHKLYSSCLIWIDCSASMNIQKETNLFYPSYFKY